MKRFKTIAIAALLTGVAGVAVTAVQADGYNWGKGHHGDRMGERMGEGNGPGFGPGPRGGRHAARQFMDRFDSNEDGVVTQAEIDEGEATRFSEADADKSGTVDLAEFKAAFEKNSSGMRVRAFQRLDADGDGTVTTEEFNAATDRMFSMLDRDGNGELERRVGPRGPGAGPNSDQRGAGRMRSEDQGGRRWGEGHHGMGPGPRGMGPGPHGMGPGPHGPRGMMENIFTLLDTDKDGKVTRAEFEEVRGTLFTSADADNSGGIKLTDFSTIWMTLHEGQTVRMFQSMDVDGDLSITAKEHADRSADLVERMDRNDDGVITKADFKRGPNGRHGRRGGWHDGPRGGDNGPRRMQDDQRGQGRNNN